MSHSSQRGPLATIAYYSFFLALCTSGPLAVFYAYQVIRGEKQEVPIPQYASEPSAPIPSAVPTSTLSSTSIPSTVAIQPTIIAHSQPIKIVQDIEPEPLRPRPSVKTQANPRPAQVTASTEPEIKDHSSEHQSVAYQYVIQKGGLDAEVESTEAVTGWDGRYRTAGEAYFYRYGKRTPSPRKFEVLTQETNGKIQGIDLTIKW